MGNSDDEGSSGSSNATEKAASRAAQVSDHIAATRIEESKPGRRRRRAKQDELPADYSDVLGQLKTLRKMAATPDGNKTGYIRQKEAGKLWVRERIEQLLDKGSFREIGSVTGKVQWKQIGPTKEEPEEYLPSNNLQGFGRLRGRQIVFTADDFSIRAGHADGALSAKVRIPSTITPYETRADSTGLSKTIYLEQLALKLKLPVIKLVSKSMSMAIGLRHPLTFTPGGWFEWRRFCDRTYTVDYGPL